MRNVELKHPYIQIKDKEQVSFGGNQAWFPQKRLASYGCGLISVGDIILYLTKYGKMPLQPIIRKVNRAGIIEKTDYLNYLRKLSHRFFYVSYFIRGISGPMLAVGFNVMSLICHSPYKAVWGVPVSKIHRAVIRMLNKDIPVLFSVGANFPKIWGKKGIKLYQKPVEPKEGTQTQAPFPVCCGSVNRHYMTITGLFWDEHSCEWLKISSWGKEYYIRWEEYENFIRHDSLGLFSNILYISEKP